MSSAILSAGIIGLHGAARVPDDLFLDDADVRDVGVRGLVLAHVQQADAQLPRHSTHCLPRLAAPNTTHTTCTQGNAGLLSIFTGSSTAATGVNNV
jgi:hypothetical protein